MYSAVCGAVYVAMLDVVCVVVCGTVYGDM